MLLAVLPVLLGKVLTFLKPKCVCRNSDLWQELLSGRTGSVYAFTSECCSSVCAGQNCGFLPVPRKITVGFFSIFKKKLKIRKSELTNHKKNPVVFVTIGISALSWAFLSGNITLGNVVAPDVSNFWYLIILIGVGAYFISSGFFGVYAMAVDTTFICFCEDLERNNGQDKPYFMSKSLLKVLGKKNKTVKLK